MCCAKMVDDGLMGVRMDDIVGVVVGERGAALPLDDRAVALLLGLRPMQLSGHKRYRNQDEERHQRSCD
jgi:hypothetical protein